MRSDAVVGDDSCMRSPHFFLADGCSGVKKVPNVYKKCHKLRWRGGWMVQVVMESLVERMRTQDLIQAKMTLIE